MVRAALAPGQLAAESFRRWRAGVDLRQVDVSTQRLLPLVVRTLDAEGGFDDDPFAAQCRKVARFTWLKSRLLVAETVPVLAGLAEAGIPAMLVKGAAVVHHTGGDLVARPMDDIDVLVPRQRALDAFGVAASRDFAPGGDPLSHRELAEVVARRHAFETVSPKGAAVDLHWFALAGRRNAAADERLWRGAVEASLGGLGCRATCREDTLVHAIAHAFGSRPDAGLRWASDVACLVRTAPGGVPDWDRVVETAGAYRVAVPVADALTVLLRVIDLPVPGEVIRRLQAAPVIQRIRAWPRLDGHGAPRLPTRLEVVVDDVEEYLGESVGPGSRLGPRGCARYLARRWALPSARQVPGHALFVAAGRPWGLARWWRANWPGRAERRVPGRSTGVPRVQLGHEVRFVLGGDGGPYVGLGWSYPEPHGIWSTGPEATVTLAVPPGTPGELVLFVRLVPFLVPLRPRLRVDLAVNGEHCARWVFEGRGWAPAELSEPLPPGIVGTDGHLWLRFVIDRPLSPEEAHLEQGIRQLGISLHALRLDRAEGVEAR